MSVRSGGGCETPGHGADVAAIVHDLNNLFMVMIAGAQASLRTGQAAEMKRCLEDVVGAGTMAARLTKQLMHLGRGRGARVSVDLNGVIEGLADVLRATLGAAVRLDFHTWHRPLNVQMSETDLDRVLLNLAGNARDAMPDGGSLRIEARPFVGSSSANRYALLVVADTGCGMDSATTARIYEPFFTTKPGKGTGLGLATVHHLVTSCGGHIHVDSEPGMGSVFRILLPQDPAGEFSSADDSGETP
jgi:two-component system cell cycle sensor histidine kinase/response regulator CckA